MIKFQNVCKTFSDVKAVDHVSFNVNPGEIVGFIGPNGSGKTTSIKMMVGILTPDEGTIEIGDFDIVKDSLKAKKRIGYIADSPDQFLRLTGREYLDFIGDIYEIGLEDRLERTDTLSKRFGMEKALDHQILSYSHGMRQKIMVIGALLHEPEEWILDEPMTGLDPESAYELKLMMREHASKGHAVLFSTHVLEVAEKLCDRVIIIRYGKVLFEGTLHELQMLHPDVSLEEIYIDMVKEPTKIDYSTNTELKEEAEYADI